MSKETTSTNGKPEEKLEKAAWTDPVALGKVKTMPEAEELPEIDEPVPTLVENPRDFELAIAQAQMEDAEYIEVSEKLFNFLVKKSKTPYITYGKPGIKVFKVGTRDEILSEEGMSAELRHDVLMKRKAFGGR